MAGELSTDEVETIAETFRDKMEEVYKEVHAGTNVAWNTDSPGSPGTWKGLTPRYSFAPVETGVPGDDPQADRQKIDDGSRRASSSTPRWSGSWRPGARR